MPDQERRDARRAVVADAPAARGLKDLGRAMVRPSAGHLILAVVMLVFGVGVGTQLTTKAADDQYATARRADLIQLLDTANAETRRLEAELAALKTTRDKLQSGVDSAKVAQAEAQNHLDTLGILNGTLPASGPGIRVVIYDQNSDVTGSMLLDAVEEFRDAGAEVIEINDSIRVVASSWFAGTRADLVVDGRSITRPIVFDVIGDSHALEESARFRGGLVSQVQRVGGTVTISAQTSVSVTATRALPATTYARPA